MGDDVSAFPHRLLYLGSVSGILCRLVVFHVYYCKTKVGFLVVVVDSAVVVVVVCAKGVGGGGGCRGGGKSHV